MENIFEILSTVEKESEDNVILTIGNIVNRDKLKDFDLISIPDNCEYFISTKHYVVIPSGIEFNVVFSSKEPNNYINTIAKLKEIKIGRGEKVSTLPKNTYGECLLEFTYGKPDILSKLSAWGEKFDSKKNELIFFTTQPVMNRILELLS